MYGWRGKLLRVNLSTGEIAVAPLDPKVAKDYIGGRGLGIYLMNKEMDACCDPFSPENMLIMATGPLTGTKAPTGARYMVMTKSPLTGAITCSNAGGKFPAAFKQTGFDAVIFTGKSEKPVFLVMENETARLEPADHLWGKTTHETTDALLTQIHGNAKVACIGPAGENRVLFASIMNDKDRAAGRSGVGAVMGSKNLKAVVVNGNLPVTLADEEGFKAVTKKFSDTFRKAAKENPPALRLHGTAVTVMATQNYGVLPTKNWQQGSFDNWEKIHGETLTKKYLVSNSACFSCPIGCGRKTKVDEPGFEGQGEGPEYETVYAMGSNCMIDNLAAVTKANYLCNEYGMDTITMGATIACAMELYDLGLLTKERVGRTLEWGDAQALVELTRLTALRQGFGETLAQGSFRLAEQFGRPELSMVSKKQEFPGYDPRGSQGMGLAYATSPIGGSHMRGDPAYFELLGVPKVIDRLEWKGKANLVKRWQDFFCVIDAAGLCVFYSVRNLSNLELEILPTGILELINAATGAAYSLEELALAGERISNAERQFLVRAGFDRKDDSLPPRMTKEPLPDGSAKGSVCHLEEMLDDYYVLRGWSDNGIPGPEKLAELGLA
ncbi:MAG: aldehyde ferredoxin oxidoreductase family protein [Proteobacteria bacterium]|nr:aldehyde ferredoxin oxidoreductase family protein [Desulfobacula sp.]MBU3950957.1 aldehyde ferredoxin oxidoreductase family protein [Pseudomonadota bacterium]MBU4129454.1 aldehyde ferredoxin oxidoreductase family protein [Pseudomonadota bacterium]